MEFVFACVVIVVYFLKAIVVIYLFFNVLVAKTVVVFLFTKQASLNKIHSTLEYELRGLSLLESSLFYSVFPYERKKAVVKSLGWT